MSAGAEVLAVSPAWLRSWVAASVDGLAEARSEIDALNVFPVPDGDTGTNLFLTLKSAWHGLEGAGGHDGVSLAAAAAATTRGALVGARGNSGVIMAQMLHGAINEVAAAGEDSPWSPARLAKALRRACDEGYRAVGQPMEGTILTVARAAADAAAKESHDARQAAEAALAAARVALHGTTEQLEALRRAGVVDAGGRGLVVVLEGLLESLQGMAPDRPSHVDDDFVVPKRINDVLGDYRGPAYEVMFLLESDSNRVDLLREELKQRGDSLVVVGGDGLWNVHVHVDDAGAAVEAALRAGLPSNIAITYLVDQSAVLREHQGSRALVVVTHGQGMAHLLTEAGCTVIPAAANIRPSTGEFLAAVEQSHAHEVIVLPSDSDTRIAAEAAASLLRESDVRVAVIPTKSIVQSLAAVAVHSEDLGFEADLAAMSAAAGATRYAGITIASKAALTTAGACAVGDVLGVIDGDIIVIGSDVLSVARDVLERMLATGGDLVTVIAGAEAPVDVQTDFLEAFRREHPLVDVVAHVGGQPLWPLIFGVE